MINEKFLNDIELIKEDQYQWEAYQASQNTVVVAGPGSGKTKVLTMKAMKLILSQPSSTSGLACLSYSKETVRELKNRLSLYGYRYRSQDYIGTVHGFCLAEIIAPYQHLYPEYEIPFPLKIASNQLLDHIYKGILEDTNKAEADLTKIDIERERYLGIIGISQVGVNSVPFAKSAAEVFEERLKASGFVDFTQIAKISVKIIQEKEYARKTLEAKFPWILIDEYQDLGKALHEMVLAFYGKTDIKIFAVGDLDQAIYGFQGAYPDFLEELIKNDDFQPISLINNYRSNQGIITGSITALNPPPPLRTYTAKLRVGEAAEFQFIKCITEVDEQYQCVAEKIIPKLRQKGVPLREIAVITGSNSEVGQVAHILKEHNIPAYVVRWNFNAGSEVVLWLMDCAKWSYPSQSIPFDYLVSFWEQLLNTHNDKRILWDETKRRFEFYEILKNATDIQELKEWLVYIIDSLGLIEMLNNSDRYPEEKENLKKLIEEASTGTIKDFDLKRFARLGHPENEVTVSTRHSVKGLEFEVIIMLGMEEGRFPFYAYTDNSPEMMEAHRLCYVCVSRAKRVCILLYSTQITIPTRRGPWTKSFKPSRFWLALHNRFGSEQNTFFSHNY